MLANPFNAINNMPGKCNLLLYHDLNISPDLVNMSPHSNSSFYISIFGLFNHLISDVNGSHSLLKPAPIAHLLALTEFLFDFLDPLTLPLLDLYFKNRLPPECVSLCNPLDLAPERVKQHARVCQ